VAVNAIDKDQLEKKLVRMQHRIRQRRDGPYKIGYNDACKDAIQKMNECDILETPTVIRCRECRHSTERQSTMVYCTIHNKRKYPDEYCNLNESDYE